jgi:hypothetical protein
VSCGENVLTSAHVGDEFVVSVAVLWPQDLFVFVWGDGWWCGCCCAAGDLEKMLSTGVEAVVDRAFELMKKLVDEQAALAHEDDMELYGGKEES